MKKIISILLTLAICLGLCSCSCSHKHEQIATPDFARTAGVWFLSGSPYAAKLEMDGAGAVTAYYPEDEGVEFEGYLAYDSKDDCYIIYTDSDEFITNFTFDSDTQIHIGDDTEHIYVKSDEKLDILELTDSLTDITPVEDNPDYHGGYYRTFVADDGTTITNTSFTSTMEADEIIEAYIVKCIAGIGDGDVSDVKIEENIEYTNKMQQHVYLVSWKSGEKLNNAFFFRTNTHTYMYVLSSDTALSEDLYLSIFDGLYLKDE